MGTFRDSVNPTPDQLCQPCRGAASNRIHLVQATQMVKRTDRRLKSNRRTVVRRRLLVEQLGDRRVLAAITGAVFDDANFSFHRDQGEVNLASRLVYIDANDNATLDEGEQFVVAEQDGTFSFPNLGDGTYLLRLFNGTSSQQQTSPVEATISGETVEANGTQLLLGSGPIVLGQQGIVLGDLASGLGQNVPVATELTKMQTLPDGTVLVIGNDEGGDTAWIVDPADESVTAVDLAGQGQPVQWADVAIDGQGHGVLIEHSQTVSTIHAVDASDLTIGIGVTTTSTTVPAGTQVLTSETGTRSVFASAINDGMQFSLWSNSSATPITETPVDVAGAFRMLAYDDASGLLVVRTFGGGVSVHDVNQDFATLHSLPDVTGPVAIDDPRDLLMTISPIDAMLRLIDMRDGALIADLALDASIIGQVSSLAIGDRPDAIVVLGAAGVTEVALNKAAANRVQVQGGQDLDSILFGVSLSDSNNAPGYDSLPGLTTTEDVTLAEPAPKALEGARDPESDQFVLIQRGPAENGVATLSVLGAVNYRPNDDFSGVDMVPVVLHDGRDVSAEISLPINVTAIPDPPFDIDVSGDPIPENILPGRPIADIEIIDVDVERNHEIVIDDGRFAVINGEIVFVRGHIDFETSPTIELTIDVHDPEANSSITRLVTFLVKDENDPITAITPETGSISENVLGDIVARLEVEDEDVDQIHELSVDDNRFVIENNILQLRPDVAVDYEAEQEIQVNVTADDGEGSSFTQLVTVHVLDVVEQPGAISLSDRSVVELEPGDIVGDVIIDGSPPNERFELTVDDPRFEIRDAILQLVEDQFVERVTQDEIELTITVTDPQGEFEPVRETFIIFVLENDTPYHNDENPYDVDHSEDVTSLDALIVINYLNAFGVGPVGRGDPVNSHDVNGDRMVSALDALLIFNEINRRNNSSTVGSDQRQKNQLQAPDDQPASEGNKVDDSSSREDVFNNWAPRQQKAADSTPDNPQSPANLPNPHQANSSEKEDYAASVDQTIHLFSSDQ